MATPWVLSTYTVEPLQKASARGQSKTTVSLDLGITQSEVTLDNKGVALPDGSTLAWSVINEIRQDSQSCYAIENEHARKIEAFSETTGRYYSLYPTPHAPTMLISGIPMHRIKETDPYSDTLSKIRVLNPVGKVLDTATGLGYTAIESAKSADSVITIELDQTVLEICRCNPWSTELFSNPRITQCIGDSFELVNAFPDGFFSRVLHDPPIFSLAGELYSTEFYIQLHRVLRHNGRLFHYIGDLNKSSGRRVARGASQRLINAGFSRVRPRPEAFALIAYKN